MRIDARRVAGFLADPGLCRVVLLFGDDAGLIRARSDRLVRAVAGRVDDPFRVVELSRDEAGSLPTEAASLALTGGRRVVRLRDATDAAADPAKTVLAGPGDALVVLEGGGLPARSRLRALLEGAQAGAAIGCYPAEGRDLEQAVHDTLTALGVAIDAEALRWVGRQLGADHAQTEREVEKLALYAGAGGKVDLAAAMDCLGDSAGLSLDDALFAATEGDVASTDRALGLALAGGQSEAAAIRAALGHVQRLFRARLAMEGGASAEQAVSSLRPPVFWRRQPALRRALALWDVPALEAALAALDRAEFATKQTGAPAEAICRAVLLTVAGQAASVRPRLNRP